MIESPIEYSTMKSTIDKGTKKMDEPKDVLSD